MSIKILSKNYLPFIITILLFLIIFFIGSNIPQETIKQIIENAGPFGVIIFIFLTWLTYVIAPLGGTPFLFAGFYLYGSRVVIYITIATFIASITNFLIARFWGRKVVEKIAGMDNLKKVDNLTKDYGVQTLIFCRVCLGQFHDVISYLFGLTTIKFSTYLIISTIGTIPGTVVWYYISTKINNPIVFTIITIVFAYTTLVLYVVYLKIVKKRKIKLEPLID